jgi:hypothetical protein
LQQPEMAVAERARETGGETPTHTPELCAADHHLYGLHLCLGVEEEHMYRETVLHGLDTALVLFRPSERAPVLPADWEGVASLLAHSYPLAHPYYIRHLDCFRHHPVSVFEARLGVRFLEVMHSSTSHPLYLNYTSFLALVQGPPTPSALAQCSARSSEPASVSASRSPSTSASSSSSSSTSPTSPSSSSPPSSSPPSSSSSSAAGQPTPPTHKQALSHTEQKHELGIGSESEQSSHQSGEEHHHHSSLHNNLDNNNHHEQHVDAESVSVEAAYTRLFLYCELRLMDLFRGEGRTMSPDGRILEPEFLVPNLALSHLNDPAQLTFRLPLPDRVLHSFSHLSSASSGGV